MNSIEDVNITYIIQIDAIHGFSMNNLIIIYTNTVQNLYAWVGAGVMLQHLDPGGSLLLLLMMVAVVMWVRCCQQLDSWLLQVIRLLK